MGLAAVLQPARFTEGNAVGELTGDTSGGNKWLVCRPLAKLSSCCNKNYSKSNG